MATVDHELALLLKAQAGLIGPDLAAMPLDQALTLLRTAKPAQKPPADETASTEDRVIPGPDGNSIPIRIYRPTGGGPFPALIHFHGGGWVGGSIGNDEIRSHRTACRARTIILSVDYRLAPEHQFPAGLEDAYATLVWTAANAGALGIDPVRIGVSGSSAGGNLAAAVTLLARDRQGPSIKFQLLTYPICDISLDFPSYVENAEAPLLTTAMVRWFIAQYLPPEADPRNPLISPLRTPDCRGLPPALVVTAACDPLRDEAEAYAAKLAQAGVDVTCTRYDGVVHGFITRAPDLAQSQAAFTEIVGALRQHL